MDKILKFSLSALRILGVWIVGLAIWSVHIGGGGFHIVFLMYGVFFSLPALFALSVLGYIELFFLKMGKPVLIYALGPVFSGIVALVIYAMAPHPDMDTWLDIAKLCVICGLLWMLTSFRVVGRR